MDVTTETASHGDLQLGNVVTDGVRIVLIDPGDDHLSAVADLGKLVGTDRFSCNLTAREFATIVAQPAGHDVDEILTWAELWSISLAALFSGRAPWNETLRRRLHAIRTELALPTLRE